MSDLGFPSVYYGPSLAPVSWVNDSADLKPAVEAFLTMDATDEQWKLVRHYLVYYISAPHWLERSPTGPLHPDLAARVRELRKTAQEIRNPRDMWAYLADCLAIGIDPL